LRIVGAQRSQGWSQPFLRKSGSVFGKFFGNLRFFRRQGGGHVGGPLMVDTGHVGLDVAGAGGNHLWRGRYQCHGNGQPVA
jgi:hypothetical protein